MKANQTVTVQIEDASGKSAADQWNEAKREFAEALAALRLRIASVRKRVSYSCGQNVPVGWLLIIVPSINMHRQYLGRAIIDASEQGSLALLVNSPVEVDTRDSWNIDLSTLRRLTAGMVAATEDALSATAEKYLLRS